MKKNIKTMTVGVAVLSVATLLQAEIINVNFTSGGRGSSVGTTYFMDGSTASMPVSYTGTNWNDSVWGEDSRNAMTDLKDTDGNTTGVGFTLSGGSNYGGDAIALDVLKEYRYFSGNATTTGISIDLAGLGANAQWDVYFLSQGNANGRTTQFRHFDGAVTNTLPASPADMAETAWVSGGNYVKFSITADAAGTASFDASSLSGNNSGSLNGLQLVAVPEPATLGLVMAVGGGLLFIRRRFMV
ncbi:PEP-CTERM sorting domain-containing protein [Pontiellaceae bacterium B1224]|nr:PEP-CTERM sorting domain-containing protein [Pontiellaceae bacterium B1224]